MRLIALVLFVVSSSLYAADSVWGEWAVAGDCSANNVSVLAQGTSLAVLFDDFGVKMPMGVTGDGTQVRKACQFRVALTPPPGQFLSSVQHVFSGGMIKSKASHARLEIAYRMGGKLGEESIVWENKEIAPGNDRSVFTQSFEADLPRLPCRRETVIYHINMRFNARRRDASEFVIGGLDSADATVKQNVRVIPKWKECPRR